MEINRAKNEKDPNWNIYSNRYNKIREKYRKIWRKIHNIRMNWRNKLSNTISNSYKVIILDDFKTPDNSKLDNSYLRRFYNSYNRNHGMCLFSLAFRAACEKNCCTVIDGPKFTTRTCSACHHVNPKLPLSERILRCEKCGEIIDRDFNAAKNCYDSYIHPNRWIFE